MTVPAQRSAEYLHRMLLLWFDPGGFDSAGARMAALVNSVVVDVTPLDFFLVLRTRATRPELVPALMAELQTYAPPVDEQAATVDWPNEPDRVVAVAPIVAALTRRGATDAFHASCLTLPFEVRLRTYLQVLVLRGLIDHASHQTADPLARARTWMELYSQSRLGMREFKRRAERHVGFHAAWLLIEKWLGRVPAGPMSERAVQRLRSAAWANATAPTRMMRHRMTPGKRRASVERRLRMSPADAMLELTSQLWLTLDAEWGHEPPLALLARSLGGELDDVGTAVFRDLQDAVRADARRGGHYRTSEEDGPAPREQLEILLKERASDGHVVSDVADLARAPMTADEVLHLAELIHRTYADPARRAFAERALSGPNSQRELARELGVNEATVAKRKRRLVKEDDE